MQNVGRYSSMFDIGRDIVKRDQTIPLKNIEMFYLNNLREYFERFLSGVSAWNSGNQVAYSTVSNLCAFPSIGSLQSIGIELSQKGNNNPVSALHNIVDNINDICNMKPIAQKERDCLSDILEYFSEIHERAENSEESQREIIEHYDD